jgi:hypothetical protein
MRPWFRIQPALIGDINNALKGRYPNLHLIVPEGDGVASLIGTFPVYAPDGTILDSFRISVEFPDDYPRSLPVVREVGGRVPHKEENHVNPADGTSCVALPDARAEYFPEGAPFLRYLEGALHNYFLGQSLFLAGNPWPFDEWAHGEAGRLEYYKQLFGTEDKERVRDYLKALKSREIKHFKKCPCGSGKKIRICCQNRLRKLSKAISQSIAKTAYQALFPTATR